MRTLIILALAIIVFGTLLTGSNDRRNRELKDSERLERIERRLQAIETKLEVK